MTEAEWLVRAQPIRMVEHIKDKTEDRRWHLLASGCVRLFSRFVDNAAVQSYLEAFDEYADGRMSRRECSSWWEPAHRHLDTICNSSVGWIVKEMLVNLMRLETHPPNAYQVARSTVSEVGRVVVIRRYDPAVEMDNTILRSVRRAAILIRDIFGNPFRPVALDPSWLTSTVKALAHQMYDSRDFSAMPILADALQDAGCDNPDILDHCRRPGPHVRGCWVVDKLLARE